MSADMPLGQGTSRGGRRSSNPLRLAAYFLTVAEEGHVGRAADRLGIAQPPLSQSLRRFEELLGVQLLARHPKGVTLTAAGRRAVPAARALVEAETALRSSIAEPMERDRPVISVAPEVPDEWVLRWASSRDLTVRRSPSQQAIQDLAEVDGGDSRQAAVHLAVVVAPSVIGAHEPGPIVATPQRLICADRHLPMTADGCSSRPLDPAGLRRLLALPIASAPRRWQPSAHDLLADELRSAGSRAHPLVVEIPDRTAGLAETVSGRAFMLSASADTPPGVSALTLPAGCLPLRLRVVIAAGGGGIDRGLLQDAAREITSDLQGMA